MGTSPGDVTITHAEQGGVLRRTRAVLSIRLPGEHSILWISARAYSGFACLPSERILRRRASAAHSPRALDRDGTQVARAERECVGDKGGIAKGIAIGAALR